MSRRSPASGTAATPERLDPQPAVEVPSVEFPFVLVTGRGLYHVQCRHDDPTGRDQRVPPRRIVWRSPSATPSDSTSPKRSRSPSAAATARRCSPVEITDPLPAGIVFATFSDPGVSINQVTGTHRDPYTHTPEYKVTAVNLRGDLTSPERFAHPSRFVHP